MNIQQQKSKLCLHRRESSEPISQSRITLRSQDYFESQVVVVMVDTTKVQSPNPLTLEFRILDLNCRLDHVLDEVISCVVCCNDSLVCALILRSYFVKFKQRISLIQIEFSYKFVQSIFIGGDVRKTIPKGLLDLKVTA